MGRGTTICCLAFAFIVLGGVAILIAWSSDKIKNPSFTINQAAIDNYNLNPDNQLNATFTLVVRSHNHDPKYTLNYNSIMVAIFHDAYSLAYVTNVGPWAQPHGEDFIFAAQPVARNYIIPNSDVAAEIRNETKLGQLKFDVRIRAYVKYEVKGWRHKGYTMAIVCAPLVINLASGKTFEGTSCDVDRF